MILNDNSFLATNSYSITRIWGGLSNHTGIEQPTKQISLWKDRAYLVKESAIRFYALGMWDILKSEKHIWRVCIASDYVAKLGQTWGSFIIAIISLQSVPKLWHDEYWIMFSIVHLSASNSVWKAAFRQRKFRFPMNWVLPKLSIQTYPHPLNWDVEVHELSTVNILPKLKTCGSSI